MLQIKGKTRKIGFKEAIRENKCDGLGLNITAHRTFFPAWSKNVGINTSEVFLTLPEKTDKNLQHLLKQAKG